MLGGQQINHDNIFRSDFKAINFYLLKKKSKYSSL